MEKALDKLHDHQRHVIDMLTRVSACLDAGADVAGERMPALMSALTDMLRAYQIFKHEGVFDPAVASGSEERTRLGRGMKVECIAAGETFRMYQQQWKAADIAGNWASYRAASRLTLNALRRHVEQEGEGIEQLLKLEAAERRAAAA